MQTDEPDQQDRWWPNILVRDGSRFQTAVVRGVVRLFGGRSSGVSHYQNFFTLLFTEEEARELCLALSDSRELGGVGGGFGAWTAALEEWLDEWLGRFDRPDSAGGLVRPDRDEVTSDRDTVSVATLYSLWLSDERARLIVKLSRLAGGPGSVAIADRASLFVVPIEHAEVVLLVRWLSVADPRGDMFCRLKAETARWLRVHRATVVAARRRLWGSEARDCDACYDEADNSDLVARSLELKGSELEEALYEYRVRGEVSTSRKLARQHFTRQVWSRGTGWRSAVAAGAPRVLTVRGREGFGGWQSTSIVMSELDVRATYGRLKAILDLEPESSEDLPFWFALRLGTWCYVIDAAEPSSRRDLWSLRGRPQGWGVCESFDGGRGRSARARIAVVARWAALVRNRSDVIVIDPEELFSLSLTHNQARNLIEKLARVDHGLPLLDDIQEEVHQWLVFHRGVVEQARSSRRWGGRRVCSTCEAEQAVLGDRAGADE